MPYPVPLDMKRIQHYEAPSLDGVGLKLCLTESRRILAEGWSKKKQRELRLEIE